MNGAESIVRTLLEGGVNTCFTNPGTSEIHFVAAMERVGALRGVPCLFEGVAVGAADGYARMTERPAATLLHLGPGFANGLANLHNAHRARVPMLNIVGDHATFHRRHDAPLTSDIEAIARPYSAWLRTTPSAEDAGRDCAEAIAATQPGNIATLILPADAAWNEGGRVGRIAEPGEAPRADAEAVARAIAMLRNGKPTAIILGGRATQGEALMLAGRIAAATDAKLLAQFAFARLERGAGRAKVERIAYVTEQALEQLRGFAQIILVGAPAPVAFFAHPAKPGILTPEGCDLLTLTSPDQNAREALRELAEALAPPHTRVPLAPLARPAPPTGAITLAGLAAAVAAFLPEQAIVVDESITSGRGMLAATREAPPHDWLVNTGGSIGIGIPLAVGAAIACPERAVLCLSGDGSAMYTLQALWTAARAQLRTTIVVFANRTYAILKGELAGQTDARAPDNALLDIGRPDLDFVGLARAMGVPAKRVATLDEFGRALQAGFDSRGPNLIEVPL